MSTLFELIDKHNVKYSDNLERMIEEYFDTRFPEPDPQPIEKLFDISKEEIQVWLKTRDYEEYTFAAYRPWRDELHFIDSVMFTGKDRQEVINEFQSFIIAEIPKF